MSFLTGSLGYIIPFLVVLTVLVFVHEMGHYLVARRAGVRIETFSIGFGPELFGWNDRSGTRWRISAIPFGGYVKMFGDADGTSVLGEGIDTMTPAERDVSFHHKSLRARAAILLAGPGANFLFAIVVLACEFATIGEPFTVPQIGAVVPDSAAAAAGLKPGDVFETIDGTGVTRFEDVVQSVMLNTGSPMHLVIRRDGQDLPVEITPTVVDKVDNFGNHRKMGQLGVQSSGKDYVKRDPLTAVYRAGVTTVQVVTGSLQALGQIVTGTRTTQDLGGPIMIAKLSGEFAKGGFLSLLDLMVQLSISLGMINLFPIPVLDGGHLLFYAAEAVLGRPLGRRVQEYGFRLGLAMVLTLMVFATWNDLVHIGVVAFLKGLVT